MQSEWLAKEQLKKFSKDNNKAQINRLAKQTELDCRRVFEEDNSYGMAQESK